MPLARTENAPPREACERERTKERSELRSNNPFLPDSFRREDARDELRDLAQHVRPVARRLQATPAHILVIKRDPLEIAHHIRVGIGRVRPAAIGARRNPAPAPPLPTLANPDRHVTTQALQGQVSLVNVWASWCVACRAESSRVAEITQRTGVPVIGLNYKDKRPDATRWLTVFGNPFSVVAVDASGRVGIDWGVAGVPETFVVDRQGVIRYKVVRGTLDTSGVGQRRQSRSRYGAKKEG